MKRMTVCGFVSFLLVLVPFFSSGSQTRGIRIVIKDASGREVGLYRGSHALLIGVSDYTAGWPSLESVPYEIDQVEEALKKQGFHVVKVMNPTSDELKDAFEEFIDRYGFDEENRLLFFFSGHGHTRKRGKKGYLVPADAPDPRFDEKGFLRKAIGMNQVLTWSREIEAKHALFLFDSCFSGTVFKAKALPGIPPHISDITSHPVRQFISAGSAGEEVPADSVFVPLFIRAVRGGGDLDGDGYVTGTELGMYLHRKVLSYETGQHPQYGKIRDPDLDEGDFVFALKVGASVPDPAIPPPRKITNYDKIIAEREAKRKKWGSWQNRMKKEFARVERYDKSRVLNAEEKAEAWEDLLASYTADNPYSMEDDEFRKRAEERKGYWENHRETGKVFVDTVPSGARVRILNIGPKFHQGMELQPGSYHVEVSSAGYGTEKRWIGLKMGEDKKVEIRLKQLRASIRPTPPDTRPSFDSNVIARDGIYVEYANGIVKDTRTGLEWKAGPDRDMTWHDARSWVQGLNLDGGGWRMPTLDELAGLYNPGAGSRNITPLLRTTGWWVWAGETEDPLTAWDFNFSSGRRPWSGRNRSSNHAGRAFAVRSRNDG